MKWYEEAEKKAVEEQYGEYTWKLVLCCVDMEPQQQEVQLKEQKGLKAPADFFAELGDASAGVIQACLNSSERGDTHKPRKHGSGKCTCVGERMACWCSELSTCIRLKPPASRSACYSELGYE
eukprot:2297186-Amphidinium_carterae.1